MLSVRMTKRQFLLQYGMNNRTFASLSEAGVISVVVKPGARNSVWVLADNLKEGEHYVCCQECGAFLSIITSKHLLACTGIRSNTYQERYPGALLLSRFCSNRKAKTEQQKQAQSICLKKRFQTVKGEVTRQQIADASKRHQASGYREQSAAHLRKLNQQPEVREARGREAKDRWADPEFRAARAAWVADHREEVEASAQHARRHIQRVSKPHQALKNCLIAKNQTFQTEYPLGPYSIDEADPSVKVAVEVDGCYWHGCENCGFKPQPGMASLDKRKNTFLVRQGWCVIRISECSIKADINACAERVLREVEDVRRKHNP